MRRESASSGMSALRAAARAHMSPSPLVPTSDGRARAAGDPIAAAPPAAEYIADAFGDHDGTRTQGLLGFFGGGPESDSTGAKDWN